MSNEEIKALAFDLIRQGVENPFDYVNEDREDLITLGVIYGMIKVVVEICKREEQE